MDSIRKIHTENKHDGKYYLRILDVEADTEVSDFALNHTFACAFVDDNKVYCYALDVTEGYKTRPIINGFVTDDMIHWEEFEAVKRPGWIF